MRPYRKIASGPVDRALDGRDSQRELRNVMKQYKARIEKPADDVRCHAVEIWFEATNIIEAGKFIMDWFNPIGITAEQVTKLIEVNDD